MPGKACDNIADPVERKKCRQYKGKYAKSSPVKGSVRKPAGGGY